MGSLQRSRVKEAASVMTEKEQMEVFLSFMILYHLEHLPPHFFMCAKKIALKVFCSNQGF